MSEATLRGKRDQAWEMAGLARIDGDRSDEAKWTEKAREFSRQLGEMLREKQ